MIRLVFLVFALAGAPVGASELRDRFVASNMIATLYHELGHALIDTLELPVLGREEDAADALSALMIHELWEEDAAVELAYDTALAYLLYDAEAAEAGVEPVYWGEHGLDLQRYYNLVCHFYGGNPEERADIAEELELPAERAERCPEEFELLQASWGPYLDEMAEAPSGHPLRFEAAGRDAVTVLLREEIADLNTRFKFPVVITVRVAACGEANAFYDPADRSITMCSEYAPDLARVFDAAP